MTQTLKIYSYLQCLLPLGPSRSTQLHKELGFVISTDYIKYLGFTYPLENYF